MVVKPGHDKSSSTGRQKFIESKTALKRIAIVGCELSVCSRRKAKLNIGKD